MARVTENIGQAGFTATLFQALECIRPIQATTLYLYPHGGMPSALFELEGPWLPQGNVRQYLSGFYLLDPFYGACIEGVSSGCYNLDDVAPDHFELGEYFQSFYRHSHLEDELNYILQSSAGLSLSVSLAFTQKLDAATTQQFKRIAPWVLAVLGKHFVGLDARGARFENLLEQRIHSALNNFGSSLLTERECRIAQLILRGHSTRSLAERLGVTEDTIKSHRKNIYSKLDIGTQSELFSLFIDSLAEAQGVLSKDPLESYMSKNR
ncbi:MULTISPECIES: helix-turn-helix transcriptional regulator [Pseudomonas]|nr:MULTISPECIES: helix-turn-helix transcriptional regulator [Pseudomonas]EPJ93320.1 LuxR family transcriptional regulator [Pseudomonas psychrophila]KAB0492079.1 helix-turn-helix transcriptional regulator [Pseudomonas psychrophila]MDY7580250.1 helix-turn-helix transcriptional regulator [Pseudomonas sp. CCI3.1]MEB0068750.1 helix-turn-helix transcriptional regulator [Pseudomonas sp. CCI3.1]MEB0074236.1 helix-turn-helix transcriptional regulator [Pseudomonas sp. CCI1.4]